jgi:zinc protease
MGVRFPAGITRRRIVAGLGPKARTEIVLSGPFDGSSEENESLGAVRDLVELALNERLREQLGETYSVDVEISTNLVPPARYAVMIDFETSPERADSAAAVALEELNRLRSAGPTDTEFEKVKAARTRDRDGNLESNRYWANELSWHSRMGWPLGTIEQHQLQAEMRSKSSVQDACRRILRTTEYVQLTMVPKATVR